ncbi:MAG: hypothetical protein GY842_18695 [bacterium]|nr:hypothetical protein [bacterium]
MRKYARVAAVLTVGGVLMQTAGCATTFGPLLLSLLENIALSQLAAGLGGAF